MTTTANPIGATTLEKHCDAVGRLYAAYGSGDMDAVLAELADDVDWAAEASSRTVPWYGPFVGKTEVPRFFSAIADHVDISEFEVLGLAAGGSDVVATVHWTYTVKATGKMASMFMQHWFRFAGGKIVFFRGSEDSEQSAAAFSAA